jgi:hypothetical protein
MKDFNGRDIEPGDYIIYINGRFGYKNSYLSSGLVTKVNKVTLKVKIFGEDYYGNSIIEDAELKPPSSEQHIIVFRGGELDYYGYRNKYNELKTAQNLNL